MADNLLVIGIYFAPGYPGPSASFPARGSACSSHCAETRGLAWARSLAVSLVTWHGIVSTFTYCVLKGRPPMYIRLKQAI